MLTVKFTTQFKKDYKLIQKQGLNMKLLGEVIIKLSNRRPLHEKYRDHALSGYYKGFRECHIKPDWLLVYFTEKDILTLTLTRMGNYSNLFK